MGRFLFSSGGDVKRLISRIVSLMAALAMGAAAAPNPDKPPFFLDMPVNLVIGSPEIDPSVFANVNALDPTGDLSRYLDQSVRLSALLTYQDTDEGDPEGPEWAERHTQAARDFDQTLTEAGVDHECLEVEAPHCGLDLGAMLELMDAHIVF
jgi:hypothetical protein